MTDASYRNSPRKTSAEIAAAYMERGWKPIPVPAGEKGSDATTIGKRAPTKRTNSNGHNIGVQMGPVSRV